MMAIETLDHLERPDVLAVFDIVDAATRHDGVTPLSEHVLLHLRHGGDAHVRHVLARDSSGEVIGYAHLDVTDEVEGPSAELVVPPAHRRHGAGSALIDRLTQESGDRLRLWAHGHTDAAESLARHHGFTSSRTLWQMRRSLAVPLPGVDAAGSVDLPEGYTARAFEPGVDEDAWLEANGSAFAHLADQGGWTMADLQRRMAEPWFDPRGFFVATDPSGAIAGFHWTKVHGGRLTHAHGTAAHTHPHSHNHGHEPIGEVYVIGVRPEHQGTGLGRALLLTGLQHLRSSGLTQAMLYVDASNTAAIRLYSDLGFSPWDIDVLYRRTEPGSSPIG